MRKVNFKNLQGHELSARLDTPADPPIAWALFAHCFTCGKNLNAVRNISRSLKDLGYGVMSFDFTGLGESQGNFAESNFSSNVQDLISAAQFLKSNFSAPQLLIGHSLGGAATIFAAQSIPSITAIVTIGSPASAAHVLHLFDHRIPSIQKTGAATINIGGRPFEIQQQFIDDLESQDLQSVLSSSEKAILICHSPQDRIVSIDNASQLYKSAKHPKSFLSLDGADHLLSNKEDSKYVGSVISAWASRYLKG